MVVMGGKIDRLLTIIEGRERNKFMTQELVRAAEEKGFTTKIIGVFDEWRAIENRLGDDYISDLVLWRGPVKYSSTEMIDRIQAWMNKNCKVTVNTKVTGGRNNTSNKLFQHGMFMLDPYLREHVLPMYPALMREYVDKLLKTKKIRYPFLMKPELGVRGEGIVLIKDENDLNKFEGNYRSFAIEQFVKSKYDWRVFVLGGVPLGVMKKLGNEDDPADFIAKSGGKKHFIEPDEKIREEVCRIAVKACEVSGLDYAGIDIIRDDDTGRFVLLETNVSGGWQNGFRKATDIDIPSKIMDWFNDRIELFEKPTRTAVSNYVERRLELISKPAQEMYHKIINFELDITKPKDLCSIDLQIKEIPLSEKLLSAYRLIKDENIKDSDLVKIRVLIEMIEQYEISRFGNYIGKDCGVMEDAIENTALYLAISSKL